MKLKEEKNLKKKKRAPHAKKLGKAKIRPIFFTKGTKFWQPTKKIIDTFFVDLEILERMAQCCHQQKWQPLGL